jgi:hypothetical protein
MAARIAPPISSDRVSQPWPDDTEAMVTKDTETSPDMVNHGRKKEMISTAAAASPISGRARDVPA